MAEDKDGGGPKRNIDIGGDSKGSVNITGDDGSVFQFNFNDQSLSKDDIKVLTASLIEKVSSKDASPYGIAGTTLHNLPYPQNPFFTGRQKILTDLHDSLTASGSSAALSQPQAIAGLGGIGKTQIATEYAYRHIKDYRGILWVTAETDSTITAGYGEIARLLKLKEKDQQDLEVVVGAVRSWLQANQGWLLVFDNADEPGIVSKYLPTTYPGRVLLTSRAATFGKLAKAVEVHEMDEDEAKKFLLDRSGIDSPYEADRTGAGNICRELGYLPLAIDHAGAFIEQTGCSFESYLEAFKAKGVEILGDPDYAAEDYQLKDVALRTVATTWLLSIERVREMNPAAEDILKLSAFLVPDGILLELLRSGADSFEEPLKQTVTDSLELNKSLGDLQSYSLIKRSQGSDQFSMHRLVQAVIRDGLDDNEQRRWVELGITCATTALPDVSDYRNWPVCDRIVPHVLSLVEHADTLRLSTKEYGLLLNEAGYYLDDRADYNRAEQLFLRALEIREKVNGPKHPETATVLNNLAELYCSRGKYDKAEPLHLRALEIREEVLSPGGPETAISLNNLALLYKNQGKYEKAEPLYLRALEIREEFSDPMHPDTAASLNNLAGLYRDQGKDDKAEPLLLRALEIHEKALGPMHPSVATSLNNLGELYRPQSRYDEAEPLLLRALEIKEEVLGPKHPAVALTLNNLALLYHNQGKYDKAEPLYRRAVEIHEKVFGPDHPTVATDFHNLGTMLYNMGREKEGGEKVRRAYRIFSTALGPGHPKSKTARGFLDGWGVEPE